MLVLMLLLLVPAVDVSGFMFSSLLFDVLANMSIAIVRAIIIIVIIVIIFSILVLLHLRDIYGIDSSRAECIFS